MTLRNFLTVAAIIAFAFGLGFILIPGPMLSLYGVGLDPVGTLVGRLFGASLLGFGVLNWLARDVRDAWALRAIIIAELVADLIGFIYTLVGQLGGVGGINALGWSTVLIYLLLALGFAYFQFMKPATA